MPRPILPSLVGAVSAALLLLATRPLAAQVEDLARRTDVASALTALRAENEWTLAQQQELCAIPAPPFGEGPRAADFRRRLELLGLRALRFDSVGNVIAVRPGRTGGPRVMLAAHLDTVFPDSTEIRIGREGSRMTGPGIGDNCRGLAVLLAVARQLRDARIETQGPLVFVGTVGEEGQGNLRGVRHLFDRQSGGRIDYFVAVDGAGLSATSSAVGSHRYRVTYRGPGGHSYGDFGSPNPVHALGRAIARIADFVVPLRPRTTFSVGVLDGGTSVNSIAMSASMDVDFRSERQSALDQVDSLFRRALSDALLAENTRWRRGERLTVDIEEIGRRPAAQQADSAVIVRTAAEAARVLGFTTPFTASSTDANYPMSLGIPAITIDGGGRGGGSHSLDEWYDDGTDGWKGPQWALLLVLALAQR